MNETELSIECLVDGFELCFDPVEPRNGSLYVVLPRDGGHETVAAVTIERLRAAALWSGAAPKWVTEPQRPAYRAQLALLEAARCRQNGVELLLARCEHPKFPSDGTRWQQWLAALDAMPVRL